MEGSPIQLLITRICGTKRDERAKTVWHNVMNTRQTLPHIHAFQHLAFIHWVLFTHSWGFPVTSQTYTPTTTQSQDLIQILKPARHDCRSLEQERESASTVGIPSPWPSGRGVLVQPPVDPPAVVMRCVWGPPVCQPAVVQQSWQWLPGGLAVEVRLVWPARRLRLGRTLAPLELCLRLMRSLACLVLHLRLVRWVSRWWARQLLNGPPPGSRNG